MSRLPGGIPNETHRESGLSAQHCTESWHQAGGRQTQGSPSLLVQSCWQESTCCCPPQRLVGGQALLPACRKLTQSKACSALHADLHLRQRQSVTESIFRYMLLTDWLAHLN